MKLATYLFEKSLSDQEFADKVGTTARTIEKWRRGERHPRGPMILKITSVTNGLVTLADFYPDVAREVSTAS